MLREKLFDFSQQNQMKQSPDIISEGSEKSDFSITFPQEIAASKTHKSTTTLNCEQFSICMKS